MTGRAIGTRLALAQARSDAARARLSTTIGALQRRATPQALAQDVAKTLKVRGIDALNGLADTARRKPLHVGLAVTLLGLFLARHQIARLLRRRGPTPARARTPSPQRGSSK
ncbi:hypothetical protein [Sphingomonas sp.]|uniref:hypothetical protein n=1 Tax=Sphingomonas sp. TaxID=28214 RepID=UPI00333F407D